MSEKKNYVYPWQHEPENTNIAVHVTERKRLHTGLHVTNAKGKKKDKSTLKETCG